MDAVSPRYADGGRCNGDGLGGRSDSTPRQNGASARVQQLPAAAETIRASVTNRVDNGVPGASVAIHGRRRSERSRTVLLTVGCRGANSRSASAHRRRIDQGAAVHRAGLRDGDLFAA